MVTLELRPLPGIGVGEGQWLTRDDFEVKSMERKSRSDAATYVLSLKEPIPLGVRAIVHLRLSLDDDASESFTQVEFSTAQPFRVTGAGCRNNVYPLTREGTRYTADQAINCGSGQRSFLLRFSSAPRGLGPVEARNLVRFTPPVDGLDFATRAKALEITGAFAWETLYKVNLAPIPLTDDKGRELEMKGTSELFIFFPRMADYLRWGASQGVLERYGPQMVPIEGRADERVELACSRRRSTRIDRFGLFLHSRWWSTNRSAHPVREKSPNRFGRLSEESQRPIWRVRFPPWARLRSRPSSLSRSRGKATRPDSVSTWSLIFLGSRAQPSRGPISWASAVSDASTERHWMRVQVTDLSLSTLEELTAVRFAVTSLSTGNPVPGAKVRLEGTRTTGGSSEWVTLMEETTNPEGSITWQAPGDSGPQVSIQIGRIVVTKGSDVLVLDPASPPNGFADNHWSASNETWLQWAFEPLSYRIQKPQWLTHIFTERPVYRPEETVHIRGYLRSRYQGSLDLVSPIEGHVVVEAPGDLGFRYPVTLSPNGSFYHAFSEPKLPTGVYSASFEDGGGQRHGRVSFRMEAYRIPRFEISLHSPDRVPLDREFDVSLTANYYAGGRVVGRPVQWRVTQFPFSWTPKQREGFLYSSDGRFSRTGEFRSSPKLEKQDTTDEAGSASIVINPAVEPTAQPRTYVVETTVIGADDQTVSATRRVIALPPFVLGLKVPRFIERARAIEPEIVVVGHDDELIAGKEVTVRLLLRQWHSILRASDFSDGVARYSTDVVDEKVFETTVESGAEPISVRLPVDRSGVYVVELEAHDRLDRAQVVAVDLYAGGDEPVTWSKPSGEVFRVSSDKASYDPGETATFVLESPFQSAKALAVIERPDRNVYQWVNVQGGAATFQLPIENVFTPRVPVHFVLMRGRLPGTEPLAGNRTDVGKPATMASTAWVSVNPVENRLEVTLEHPERALPGETVEVEIRLQDPKGQPKSGEVTLWLVDQAVLALGKEQRLDPVPDFITPVQSFLTVRDTRNMAFGFLPFLENPGGGEGDEEAPSLLDRVTVRKNFQPVPFYKPDIAVGTEGTATITIDLPDNLTNFKVRAKATSGPDRLGYATGTLAVRLPVIVQPALPRFVRPGDRFTAAAIGRVVEGEGGPGSAEVRVEGVELEGEARREMTWVPNQPERIEFDVDVSTPPFDENGELAYDEVVFRVGVERASDQASDGFEVKLPVRNDRRRVTRRLLTEMEPGTPVAIPEVAEPARNGTVRRTVLVSDQPALVRMAAGLDFLLNYPYGCTEQRISRARAQIALKKFRDLLGQADPGENDEALERGVRQTQEWIASVVDSNGLVAYWPGGGGYVSLTAWVLQFLVEAEEAGFPVDEELKGVFLRSLEQALRSDYSHFIDGESYAERTLGAERSHCGREFQLRLRRGAVPPIPVPRSRRPFTSSPFLRSCRPGRCTDGPRAHPRALGRFDRSPLSRKRDLRRAAKQAAIASWSHFAQRDPHRGGDDPGDLVETQPTEERLQVLVNALVTLGRGDGWGSTNANAAALLALSQLLSPPFEGSSANRFRVEIDGAGETLSTGPESPVGQFVSTSAASGRVTWTPGGGTTPVVLRAETSYVPAADGSQVAAESNGFVVTREMLRVLGKRRADGSACSRCARQELRLRSG